MSESPTERNNRLCREWYARNREAQIERGRRRRMSERGKLLQKLNYERTKERQRPKRRQRYLDNKAHELNRNKRWAKSNPDKIKAIRERTAENRNAKYRQRYRDNPAIRERVLERRNLYRARIAKATVGDRKEILAFYRHVKTAEVIECYLCHMEVPPTLRCVDHVVPLAKGGEHSVHNLRAACRKCNAQKFTKSLELFTLRIVPLPLPQYHPEVSIWASHNLKGNITFIYHDKPSPASQLNPASR